MTTKDDHPVEPAAEVAEESERRAFIKKVGVAAGGALVAAAASGEANAQVLKGSLMGNKAGAQPERGRVSATLTNLRQLQSDEVARGAITNAAIGIAKNMGGAAADFGLSFTLNWFPGGENSER